VTFGPVSEKFPFMKAWICIYTIAFAAGMVTALAGETKTNMQTDATTGAPNTNAADILPPLAAPVVTNEVKLPIVAPMLQTSAVPVQSNITATPRTPTKTIVPLPMTATSAPAPVVANGMKPPVVAPLEQTSAVPAQTEITHEPQTPTNAAAPPPESSGTGHTGVLAGGVVILAGVLGIFIWRRSHAASQGSLITSAMNENQKSHEDKNAPPPMA
jgi:hypothetical protein